METTTDFAKVLDYEIERGGAERQTSDGARGFVKWTTPGQGIRGELVEVFTIGEGSDARDVAKLAVDSISAPVYAGAGDARAVVDDIQGGDTVNVSLNLSDLRGRITMKDAGSTVTILYIGDKPTKNGKTKREMRVVVRPV